MLVCAAAAAASGDDDNLATTSTILVVGVIVMTLAFLVFATLWVVVAAFFAPSDTLANFFVEAAAAVLLTTGVVVTVLTDPSMPVVSFEFSPPTRFCSGTVALTDATATEVPFGDCFPSRGDDDHDDWVRRNCDSRASLAGLFLAGQQPILALCI